MTFTYEMTELPNVTCFGKFFISELFINYMESFGIAVKAFVVKDGKLLIIKRADDEIHEPGIWELPGGRLYPGEDPRDGLKRETKEETGLEVEVKNPLNVQHFQRDDGQWITMIIFLCEPQNKDTSISKEHSESEWVEIERSKEKLSEYFHREVDIYRHKFIN